jgi:hypothetical protein
VLTEAEAGAAIDGTWVVTTDQRLLQSVGVSDFGDLANNGGTFVFTFHDGAWRAVQTPVKTYTPEQTSSSGRTSISGGAITVHWGNGATEATRFVARRTRDGSLTFSEVRTLAPDTLSGELDRALFLRAGPWRPLARTIEAAWSITLRAEDLRLAGMSSAEAARRAGRIVLRLADGRWTLTRPDGSESSGVTTLVDDVLTIHWSGASSTTVSVRPTPEGGLSFARVHPQSARSAVDAAFDRAAFTDTPWSRT